ncbi:MAG TPA: hypothetical protein PKO18_04390 [Chitinophagales bacterium]|nr:hypothetical protein [Chitinophagales bacterium]HNL84456.1 hypothetical protein [Chitinophagales bacterium]
MKYISFNINLFYLLFQLAFTTSCVSQDKYNYWVNLNYSKCLQSKLPCECINSTQSFIFIITTNKQASRFWGISNSDPEYGEYYLYKKGTNRYYIKSINLQEMSKFGFFLISNDTLENIHENNRKEFFTKYYTSDSIDFSTYAKQNIALIDTALKNKGYKSLQDITMENNIGCECNFELGEINFISTKGLLKYWILENDSSVLNLYELSGTTNKCYPMKLDKKLIKSFKL